MNKRLFVGNLDYSTTEHQLREAFSAFGTIIDALLVTDRMTGLSRGFGFIEMENDSEADRAIDGLNGTALGGRNISVIEARERSGGGGNREGGGSHRGGRGGSYGGDRS